MFAIYSLHYTPNSLAEIEKSVLFSFSDKRYYNEVKGFLRIVSNPPLRTQAFGSIEVDMTLLPNFIMFIVSYTVIALQYKNLF